MEQNSKVILPEDVIINTVLEFYNISRELFFLNYKTKKRELVLVRQLSMVFMKRHTMYSLSRIGRVFGKNHATVIHAEKKINGYIDSYENFRNDITALNELVRLKISELPKLNSEKAGFTKPIVMFTNGIRVEKRFDNNRWHYILKRNGSTITMLDITMCKMKMGIENNVSIVIPDSIPENKKINELHLWEVQ